MTLIFQGLFLPKPIEPPHRKAHNHKLEQLYMTQEDMANFVGTALGYCGVWAVSVAEDYEGHRKGAPTLEEWQDTAEELHIDRASGGISAESLIDYYQHRNYTVQVLNLQYNKCYAQTYAARALDKGCVVFDLMWLPGVGGHVETVLGVNSCNLETNSWGTKGTISVKNSHFSHSHMTMFDSPWTQSLLVVACHN